MTRRPQPATAWGFTLVEMLVVLVLISLLGTLVIQGTGFFLGQYETVKRNHRESSLAALRQHWFISTVAAMVPSRLARRRFAGDDRFFARRYLSATGRPARPAHPRSLVPLTRGTVLYNRGRGEPGPF